jgi:hypothetical protein
MAFNALRSSWYYTIDHELRLIHAFGNCRAAKMAKKYNYGEDFRLATDGDADKLDELLASGYRICHPCWKREAVLARKDGRRHRPGYGKEPRK